MTNEAIRIAMATALGWVPETRKMYAGVKNVQGIGFNTHLHPGDIDRKFIAKGSEGLLPNYPEDLNACHEAEKTLNNAYICDSYVRYICVIQDWKLPLEANPIYVWKSIVSATALQRCEAFLRTVGKWVE